MNDMPAHGRWVIHLSLFLGLMLAVWPLPDAVQPYWPAWPALILIYWALALPHRVNVGTFWVVGLLLDVLKGALLGEHALALTVVAWATAYWHLQVRVFPVHQQIVAIGLLLGLYEFVLFWIRGIAGVGQPLFHSLAPVITSALVWPWLFLVLRDLRRRRQVS
ncbi:MAG TPA: rod shape-determining protein MreD [Gammaproteobacteria bacterium]|nr:rod shape-determining protein MreD [Gammaproteobacteria bacterium]